MINPDEKCGVCGCTGLKWVEATMYGHKTKVISCPGRDIFPELHEMIEKKQALLDSLPPDTRRQLGSEILDLRGVIQQRVNIKQT